MSNLKRRFVQSLRPEITSKWPALLVWGEAVSKEYALEVIRRTDMAHCSFISTNDNIFRDEFERLMFGADESEHKFQNSHYARKARWDSLDEARNIFGALQLSHLGQQWVCSCSINGNHGWMHPDGIIQNFSNIGKWPSLEEVEVELDELVQTFPDLLINLVWWDMEAITVHNNGWVDEPNGGWIVDKGKWHLKKFTLADIPDDLKINNGDNYLNVNPLLLGRSHSWTIKQLKDMWGEHYDRSRKACQDTYQKVYKELTSGKQS